MKGLWTVRSVFTISQTSKFVMIGREQQKQRRTMNNDIIQGFDNENNDRVGMKLQKIEEVEGGLVIYATGQMDTCNSPSFLKRAEKAVDLPRARRRRRSGSPQSYSRGCRRRTG